MQVGIVRRVVLLRPAAVPARFAEIYFDIQIIQHQSSVGCVPVHPLCYTLQYNLSSLTLSN